MDNQKKKVRRQIHTNIRNMNNILCNASKDKPLSQEKMEKVNGLLKQTAMLREILVPTKPVSIIDPNLIEIEKKYALLHGTEESDPCCSNCGEPSHNNKVNGKLWCLKCNKPLIITHKKPQTAWTPKLSSVTVEKAEIEDFKLKQNQLGL